jgi:hypothetical protein
MSNTLQRKGGLDKMHRTIQDHKESRKKVSADVTIIKAIRKMQSQREPQQEQVPLRKELKVMMTN